MTGAGDEAGTIMDSLKLPALNGMGANPARAVPVAQSVAIRISVPAVCRKVLTAVRRWDEYHSKKGGASGTSIRWCLNLIVVVSALCAEVEPQARRYTK
jgi:hypothetical protein